MHAKSLQCITGGCEQRLQPALCNNRSQLFYQHGSSKTRRFEWICFSGQIDEVRTVAVFETGITDCHAWPHRVQFCIQDDSTMQRLASLSVTQWRTLSLVRKVRILKASLIAVAFRKNEADLLADFACLDDFRKRSGERLRKMVLLVNISPCWES